MEAMRTCSAETTGAFSAAAMLLRIVAILLSSIPVSQMDNTNSIFPGYHRATAALIPALFCSKTSHRKLLVLVSERHDR